MIEVDEAAYDRVMAVNVNGTATLGGTLQATLWPGFTAESSPVTKSTRARWTPWNS